MTDDSNPNPNRWWFHRRMMAYIALSALVVTMAAILFGSVNPELSEPIQGIAWVFGFVVLGYYGNNALEAFANRNKL
ncbi:MAG: hypothetical protein R3180_00160 [Marinobacter sp.]|nr:hypothetical protein [Marinobacter sp.]